MFGMRLLVLSYKKFESEFSILLMCKNIMQMISSVKHCLDCHHEVISKTNIN